MGRKGRVNHSDKLPWYKTLAWSTRGVSMACNAIILGNVTYYCTNILGMPPTLVGTLLLVSKLMDGVTDLIAGYIVDNTNTRFGKARPYEISIFGVWITTFLMFSCPELGMVGKAIWVFTTYTFANSVFATLLNASESVYISRAAKTDDARNILVTVNGFVIMIGSVFVSTIFPVLMGTLGTTQGGWSKMVAIFALPLGVIGIGRFLFVKERDDVISDRNQKVDMKTLLQALRSNKFIFLLAGAVLLISFINSSAVGTYYFQYIVGDVKKASVVGMISLVTPIALVVMPAILKKMSVSRVVIVGGILGVVANIIKGFAGANMGMIVIGNLIGVLAALPLLFYTSIMVISCMDYSEWKNGERVEAAFSAVNGFASKVGAGLASTCTGFVMGLAGFDGKLAVQSDSAINAIVALYSWIPAVMFLIIVILMKFYKLDDMMPQIRSDLETRRKNK